MTFALSRAYLDRSQSGVYLQAAREQLGLARKQIQMEQSLWVGRPNEYRVRLLELSELEDRLRQIYPNE